MTLTTTFKDSIESSTRTLVNNSITHIATGDDNTAASAGDTALGNETFRDIVDETDLSVPGEVTKTLLQGSAENNGNNVWEIGCFDASSGGNLQFRFVLNTVIAKSSDFEISAEPQIANEVIEV